VCRNKHREYRRRALLKFDTQNTIPADSHVTSALLRVTVRMGNEDGSRRVAAFEITNSWTEHQVTWNERRPSQPWATPGGDLGPKLDEPRSSPR
jgi:hypothetical protein